MKARKKGESEWKEYKEVFGPYGEFQGLETAGYYETAEQNYLRLGGTINPDDEFQESRLKALDDVYISKVLPLECFDLWKEDDWQEFRKQAACMTMCGLLANPERQTSHTDYGDTRFFSNEEISDMAVWYADALIEKLKGGSV